jgi:hypothetical protein
MRLIKETFSKRINENLEEIKNTIVIGDSIGYYVSIGLNVFGDLVVNKPDEREYTTKTIITQLQTQEPNENIKNVILSIGSFDYFSSYNQIGLLCDIIFELYPNANYYVIEGFLDADSLINFDEDEIDELEEQRYDYYKDFYNNGFEIIESGDLFSEEVTEANSSKIISIINEINSIMDTDPTIVQKEKTNKILNASTDKNDDETDFDTIYEFINRFEKIVKSNNVYSSSLSSKTYDPDVHQIEVALRFLLSGTVPPFQVDGVFDSETEKAIKKFQLINDLEDTGVADPETLEELYYELKSHSFDHDDLAQYLEDEGIEITKNKKREFTGSVDSVWRSFTNKIIDNFEGGYWNNDVTKPNSQRCINHPSDPLYNDSGETMFGIDRRAGDWDNDSDGREYFGIIDDEKDEAGSMEEFCKTWTWGYRGGSLQEDLKLRAAAMMKKSYDRNKRYLTDEALSEVEKNKRLLFHFAYACWNGPGHFQDFAEDMNSAVSSGLTSDELVDVAVSGRNEKFGGGGWAKTNKKVVDTIKNDPELEN